MLSLFLCLILYNFEQLFICFGQIPFYLLQLLLFHPLIFTLLVIPIFISHSLLVFEISADGKYKGYEDFDLLHFSQENIITSFIQYVEIYEAMATFYGHPALSCILFYKQYKMFNFIDFRNAVYQGQLQDGKPHGLGILIDHQLLFMLAQFRYGEVEGPVFAVYPDCKIFCGQIKSKELSGLCCFFLKDRMRVFMNYSQQASKDSNVIAVLPLCKVLLEVENPTDKHPKITRYQNYGEKRNELKQLLHSFFGSYYDLEQFDSWQAFLIINFIETYHKKLHWKVTSENKYTQSFLGIKNSGLGIRMMVFHDDQQGNNIQGSPILVSAIGNFLNGETLEGYGQKLIDYQLFAKVEEGLFSKTQKETLQYIRRSRPGKVRNFFQKNLLKSVNFQNIFFNLNYFYQLQKMYAKLNVSLVEETQKTALVTINRPDDPPIQMAQKQRRQISPNTKYSPITNPAITRNQTQHQIEEVYWQQYQRSLVSEPIYSSPNSMTQAKRSIYSSVEKIKKINPETRINAIKNFNKMIQGKKIIHIADPLRARSKERQKTKPITLSLKEKLEESDGNIISRLPNNSIKQTPKFLREQEVLLDYERLNQVDYSIQRHREQAGFVTPSKSQESFKSKSNATDTNIILDQSQEAAYHSNIIPTNHNYFQSLPRHNTDKPVQPTNRVMQRQMTPQKYVPEAMQSDSCQPLKQSYKEKILQQNIYSKYQQRIRQKQQQLRYFNNLFGITQPQQDLRAVSPILKNRTPGKIKTINRKRRQQFHI